MAQTKAPALPDTRWSRPGQSCIEAFNSRFKDENRSLFLEANTLTELCQVVNDRMQHYNYRRRHSSIGYVPPMTYLKQALRSRPSPPQIRTAELVQ